MEDRLRKFACIAETRSFTKAAADLHISQPALSTAMSKLERELKAKLLVRGRSPLQLTTAGELAYRHAKELDVKERNFKLRLSELADQKPTFAIGMIDSLAETLFVYGGRLAELEAQAHVMLSVNNSRYLMQALARGDLDLAFIAQPSEAMPEHLSVSYAGSEPLVTVTASSKAAEMKTALRAGFLPDFIDFDQHSHTSQLIHRHFAAQYITLQTVFRSTSPSVILQTVLAGRGTAVLPYLAAREHLQSNTLSLITPPIPRPVNVLRSKDRELPQIIGNLRDATRQLLKQLAEETLEMG